MGMFMYERKERDDEEENSKARQGVHEQRKRYSEMGEESKINVPSILKVFAVTSFLYACRCVWPVVSRGRG